MTLSARPRREVVRHFAAAQLFPARIARRLQRVFQL
jgi:hypothetical protein